MLVAPQVSQVQLAGYCVSLSGFVWYNYLKFTGNGPGLKPAGGSQGGAKGHPGPVRHAAGSCGRIIQAAATPPATRTGGREARRTTPRPATRPCR